MKRILPHALNATTAPLVSKERKRRQARDAIKLFVNVVFVPPKPVKNIEVKL